MASPVPDLSVSTPAQDTAVPHPGTAAGSRERLVLAAAVSLHANGQETGETVKAASRLSEALGVPAALFPRWGALLLQTEAADGHARLRAHAATSSAVNMNRVAAIMRCVDAVCAKRLPVTGAEAAFEAATAAAPASLALFVLACVTGASALALIFGAAHPKAMMLVALSAGAVLRRTLAARGADTVLQAFAAALLAGIVGALAVRWNLSSALRLVAICPCMILVPGPHILNGALDMAALRIPLGASRLAFAALVLLAICAGLLIGLALGGTTLPVSEPGRQVPLWIDTLAAGAAVASYSVFFSMPLRMLAWPVVVGMLAHAVRWWGMSAFGIDAALGAGLACLLVGAAMVPITGRLRLPFAAVGFASVVSLMPGIFIFRIGSALVQLQGQAASAPALAVDALSDATTALLIVVAMTLGLVAPKHLYDRLVALERVRSAG